MVDTTRRANADTVVGKGEAGTVKTLISTVELPTSATGTTIDFGSIPSNARILGNSTVYWDDLGTGGAPDLDLGLVGDDITDDPDALNDGLDLSAAGSAAVVKDKANYGLPAWDFVNGQTSDPGGSLGVEGLITTAATDAVGTVTLELLYYLD